MDNILDNQFLFLTEYEKECLKKYNLSEEQLENLLSVSGCMECGRPRIRKIHYPFPYRWCKDCLYQKTISDFRLQEAGVPISTLGLSYMISEMYNPNGRKNYTLRFYLISEVENKIGCKINQYRDFEFKKKVESFGYDILDLSSFNRNEELVHRYYFTNKFYQLNSLTEEEKQYPLIMQMLEDSIKNRSTIILTPELRLQAKQDFDLKTIQTHINDIRKKYNISKKFTAENIEEFNKYVLPYEYRFKRINDLRKITTDLTNKFTFLKKYNIDLSYKLDIKISHKLEQFMLKIDKEFNNVYSNINLFVLEQVLEQIQEQIKVVPFGYYGLEKDTLENMEIIYCVSVSKTKLLNELKTKVKMIPGIESKRNNICRICNDKRIFKTVEALNQHNNAKHR